jgi:lysozyme
MMATPATKIVAAVLSASAIATGVVAEREGLHLKAYYDVVGVPTVCYGHTRNVVFGKAYTLNECLRLLAGDLVDHGVRLSECVDVSWMPQESLAAFISFTYNVGIGAFCKSTAAAHLKKKELAEACAQLSRWVYAGGKVYRGLVIRREIERTFCERGYKEIKLAWST